jgi:hypothetical protein
MNASTEVNTTISIVSKYCGNKSLILVHIKVDWSTMGTCSLSISKNLIENNRNAPFRYSYKILLENIVDEALSD